MFWFGPFGTFFMYSVGRCGLLISKRCVLPQPFLDTYADNWHIKKVLNTQIYFIRIYVFYLSIVLLFAHLYSLIVFFIIALLVSYASGKCVICNFSLC